MSQEAIAARCGVVREMWGKYERGDAWPGGEVWAAIAGTGADVNYILTGDRDYIPPDPLSPREAVLLDNYRRADDEGRRTIEATAALAGKANAPLTAHLGGDRSRKQVFHGAITAVAGRDIVSGGAVHVRNYQGAQRKKGRPQKGED